MHLKHKLLLSLVLGLFFIPVATHGATLRYECAGWGVGTSQRSQQGPCTLGESQKANLMLNGLRNDYLEYQRSSCDSACKDSLRQSMQTRLDTLGYPTNGEDPVQIYERLEGVIKTQEQKAADYWDNNCTGLSFLSVTCIWRAFSVLIGTALITISAWFLALASVLFNVLVDHTIIAFGKIFTEAVRDGINTGWSAMRDVADIVIIGLFVFISINYILGVEEYGRKRLVARVLIVAVLINFSLLFSQMIIDASNFVATQFYQMSGLSGGDSNLNGLTSASGGIQISQFSQKGIAGQFIKFAGLPSAGATAEALSASAFGTKDNNYTTASGWTALLHGLVIALLFGIAAFILFYGCVILLTRAIMVTLVMLTSAIAFASFLIPHHSVEIGWDKWWKALLKSAFLGPILIGLLWAVAIIAQSISESPTFRSGTLAKLITNPTGTPSVEAFIGYALVMGLLFAVFYATQELTSSISGFGATKGLVNSALKMGGIAAPALAWRFGAAPLLRQTLGRGSHFLRDGLLGYGKDARTEAGHLETLALDARRAGDEAKYNQLMKQSKGQGKTAGRWALWAGRAETFAKSGYNLGDAGMAKQLSKALGISELMAGQRPKDVDVGFHQAVESKVKLGEERSKALGPSPAERQKTMEDERKNTIRDRARETEGDGSATEFGGLKQRHAAAQRKAAAARAAEEADDGGHIATARGHLTTMMRETERIKDAEEKSARERISGLQTQFATANPADRITLQESMRQAHADRDAAIARANQGLDVAKNNLKALEKPMTEAATELEAAAGALDTYNTKTNTLAQQRGTAKYREKQVGAISAAEYLGEKSAGVFFRSTGVGHHIGEEVVKKVRGRIGTGQQLRASLAEMLGEGGAQGGGAGGAEGH